MSSSIEEILSRCRPCSPVYKPGEGAVLRDLRGPIDTAFDQKRPPRHSECRGPVGAIMALTVFSSVLKWHLL
jgi:hypothetical protein